MTKSSSTLVQFNNATPPVEITSTAALTKAYRAALKNAKKFDIGCVTLRVSGEKIVIKASASLSDEAVQFYSADLNMVALDIRHISQVQFKEIVEYLMHSNMVVLKEFIPPFEFFVKALNVAAQNRIYDGGSILNYMIRWGRQKSFLCLNMSPDRLWNNAQNFNLLQELFEVHSHTLPHKPKKAANDPVYVISMPAPKKRGRGRPRKYIQCEIKYA